MAAEVLAEEQAFYAGQRESLLATSEGKYALIKGTRLVGTYDTPSAAYADGISKLGNVPMLIVHVVRDEPAGRVPALTLGLIHAGVPS
jgi:hypothetical protein